MFLVIQQGITDAINAFRVQTSSVNFRDTESHQLRDLSVLKTARRRVIYETHAKYKVITVPYVIVRIERPLRYRLLDVSWFQRGQ